MMDGGPGGFGGADLGAILGDLFGADDMND